MHELVKKRQKQKNYFNYYNYSLIYLRKSYGKDKVNLLHHGAIENPSADWRIKGLRELKFATTHLFRHGHTAGVGSCHVIVVLPRTYLVKGVLVASAATHALELIKTRQKLMCWV